MRTTFRHGKAAADHGTDITIHLSPDEDRALGGDSGLLVDWLTTAFAGMVRLRGGWPTDTDQRGQQELWYWVINDVHTHLLPNLEAVRDAAIRAHAAADGSHGDLGLALGVPRSTAQSRRNALLGTEPSHLERWATGNLARDLERWHADHVARSADTTTD